MTATATPTAADIEHEADMLRSILAHAEQSAPITVREGRQILVLVADLARLVAEHEHPNSEVDRLHDAIRGLLPGGPGPQAGIRFCDEPGCLAMQKGHPGPHNYQTPRELVGDDPEFIR
jgi:hypothetical protein